MVSDASTVWTPDGTDSSVTRSSPAAASCDATSAVSSVDASASYWSGESFWSDTCCSVTSVYWCPGRVVGRGGCGLCAGRTGAGSLVELPVNIAKTSLPKARSSTDTNAIITSTNTMTTRK